MSGSRTPVDARGARYYAKHLLPYEDVVAAERRHWAQLIGPVATTVLGLFVAVWLDTNIPQNVPVLGNLIWIAWIASLVYLAYRCLDWRTDWFVATNKRVILANGLLTRTVAMMPLAKVTDMSYNRSVLGRLLGYGEFVLESAGQDQALRRVRFLPHPDALYEEICLEIFGASPPPPPPPPSGTPTNQPGRRPDPNAVTTIVPIDRSDD